jgi:hypothetical protein
MGASLNYDGVLTAFPAHAAEVTPHDTNELTYYSLALYVGVGGDIKVTTVGGETATFANVPIGTLQVRAKIVWSTGTTATSIVSLY